MNQEEREERTHRAMEEWGEINVNEVKQEVSLYGIDGAYAHFRDEERLQHLDCLVGLYLE